MTHQTIRAAIRHWADFMALPYHSAEAEEARQASHRVGLDSEMEFAVQEAFSAGTDHAYGVVKQATKRKS